MKHLTQEGSTYSEGCKALLGETERRQEKEFGEQIIHLKSFRERKKNAICMKHGEDTAKDEEVLAGYRASSWGRGS